jgi:hypothetical protein
LIRKKGAGNGALFVAAGESAALFDVWRPAQKFPQRHTEFFAAVHNDQNQGSKPRGAGVNFAGARPFYSTAKL